MLTVASALLLAMSLLFSACKEPKKEQKDQGRADTVGQGDTPPVVQKRLKLDVVYPVAGQPRPSVDSNFIFGSVGAGGAYLTINGATVPVAPNGAFLAFLPVPVDGQYKLIAQIGTSERDSIVHSYGAPPLPSSGNQSTASTLQRFASPLRATIVTGSDTMATGSDVTGASPTIGADRKWMFPRGAVMSAVARQGNQVQVQLVDGVTAWVPDTSLRIDSMNANPVTGARTAGMPSLNSYGGYTDVRVTSGFAPFLIEPGDRQITLTLYGLDVPSSVTGGNTPDSMITGLSWGDTKANTAKLNILLEQPLWGYKAFYDRDGAVVLRVRRPPVIDRDNPFAGIKIMIDPGHPPIGATGPTRLTEAEANLAISLPLAQKLRARGAEVVMTRTTGQAPRSMTNSSVDLWYRAEMAITSDAHVFVSVHNNAFPDGVNPFRNVGTSTYYYHPHSRDLARALNTSILRVTNLPDKLANQRSLAVVRPSWLPAALTESLYMMFPEQESMLRDPQFLDRLAQAHVDGLEAFLRERARQANAGIIEK
jgi:N-acetylmuramoyl-L-alanine amidase